jgi:hypothetical protein
MKGSNNCSVLVRVLSAGVMQGEPQIGAQELRRGEFWHQIRPSNDPGVE